MTAGPSTPTNGSAGEPTADDMVRHRPVESAVSVGEGLRLARMAATLLALPHFAPRTEYSGALPIVTHQVLLSMGYTQELHRGFNWLHSFAFCFTAGEFRWLEDGRRC